MKIVKDEVGRVQLILRTKLMEDSSAVKREVTPGKLPSSDNEGKITPNPTPPSDFEMSVNAGMESECVEQYSKNNACDSISGNKILIGIAGPQTEMSGNCQ